MARRRSSPSTGTAGMHVYPTFLANNALILLALTSMIIALKYMTTMMVRRTKQGGHSFRLPG